MTPLTNLLTSQEASTTDSGSTETNTEESILGQDEVVLAQDPIRVEAESLNWTGNYKIIDRSFASDVSLISNNVNNQSISGTILLLEKLAC